MAAVLTAAVELTIVWNNIGGVNEVADVAQMVPLLLSAGIVVRAVMVHFVRRGEDDDSDSVTSSGNGPTIVVEPRGSGGMPPPPVPPA